MSFLFVIAVFLPPNMKQFRRCSTQPGLTTGGRELENFRLGWGVIFDCGSLAAKMCNQQRHTCPDCGVVGGGGGGDNPARTKHVLI